MSARAADDEIIRYWRDRGLHDWKPDLGRPTFSSVIPAPNPTGELHMGHALNLTIQDILCRWHRMTGREVLWAGALDHGNFSTQTVVERELLRRGIRPQDLGDERMRQEIADWITALTPRIFEQIQQFGVLMDLAEPRSMGDEHHDRVIGGYFVELHRKGLAYEADAVTIWCPTCRTSIDRTDVVDVEAERVLYHLAYQVAGDSGTALTVVTATPETLPADVALVADAADARRAHLVGRALTTPLGDRIPLWQAEELPEHARDGVARVSPGHCGFGAKLARARGVEARAAYDERGVMQTGPFAGRTRAEARTLTREAIAARGALLREEPLREPAPACRKCGAAVEPFRSRQWFLRVEPMLEPTLELLATGRLAIYPRRYEAYCRTWLGQQLRAHRRGALGELSDDWCVSRQIRCGNRLPVLDCECGARRVETGAARCERCARPMRRSPDVMDMKLSCALWAYCANRTYTGSIPALARIAEDAVCVTGLDLLLFWIMPIAMLSTQLDDPLPFRSALIHPIVCDALGRKMSKSVGNVVVPTELLDQYGADCLRLALLDRLDLSADKMPFSTDRLEENRRLLDELSQALERLLASPRPDAPEPDAAVEQSFARLAQAVEAFAFHELHPEIRRFIGQLASAGAEARATLLPEALVLLHPFIPILTERIWRAAYPDRRPLASLARADRPPVAVAAPGSGIAVPERGAS